MATLKNELNLIETAKRLFDQSYGGKATAAASAPGRVNIIGEHVDYCDGFVLPMALEQRTVVIGRENDTNTYNFVAESMPTNENKCSFTSDQLAPTHGTAVPHWSNYVRGIVAQFDSVPGFDAVIVSDVPIGGGLSSSAAIEVSTHVFIEELMHTPVEPSVRAKRCQHAEHDWANMPCGIMDQAISSLGQKDHLLLLDCRDLSSKQIVFTDPSITVVITNSNVKHQLTGSEYPTRRRQTVEACEAIKAQFPSVISLRDATMSQLDAVKATMDPIVYQRGHHVIGEIERTTQFAKLLQENKYQEAGKLMYDSHWSLSKDFGVSTDELDLLVDICSKFPGVIGSRMTGGGFGGCTVTFVLKEKAAELIAHIHKNYTLGHPTCFISNPGAGAYAIPL